ncbi:MAG: hypothetical protein HZA91_01940 [Verrucomicrobia bacterium]|nr:hypothetical protein [Verrucomicrobiota bacterium]
MDRELRALDKEMRVLEKQIHQLQRNPAKAATSFKPAATAFPPGRGPAPAAPVPAAPLPRERDLWVQAAETGQDGAEPGGWRGWWQGLFQPRPGPADPKLVSYLSAGSFKTVRPLRSERRVARNRFLFGLGLLIGTLALLMLALKNC